MKKYLKQSWKWLWNFGIPKNQDRTSHCKPLLSCVVLALFIASCGPIGKLQPVSINVPTKTDGSAGDGNAFRYDFRAEVVKTPTGYNVQMTWKRPDDSESFLISRGSGNPLVYELIAANLDDTKETNYEVPPGKTFQYELHVLSRQRGGYKNVGIVTVTVPEWENP